MNTTITIMICSLSFFAACSDSQECADGPTGATIGVVNQSSHARFIYQGYENIPLSFFTKKGEWKAFLPSLGCHANCNGCSNSCFNDCSPVFPEWCAQVVEEIADGGSKEYVWKGHMTESPFEEFPTCYCPSTKGQVNCLNEMLAPKGEYKIELCHAASFTSQTDGCGGSETKGLLDDPTCVDVEFMYDSCDREPITLTLK